MPDFTRKIVCKQMGYENFGEVVIKVQVNQGVVVAGPDVTITTRVGEKDLADTLQVLPGHQRMTGTETERAQRSHRNACSLRSTQTPLKNFDRSRQRLDTLW